VFTTDYINVNTDVNTNVITVVITGVLSAVLQAVWAVVLFDALDKLSCNLNQLQVKLWATFIIKG